MKGMNRQLGCIFLCIKVGLSARSGEGDNQVAIEVLARNTTLCLVTNSTFSLFFPKHLVHAGEEPKVWFWHPDQGHDEIPFTEVPSLLVRLPLVEYTLTVGVQRIAHAVPCREVKLAPARNDVPVKGLEPREQSHVTPSGGDVVVAAPSSQVGSFWSALSVVTESSL